MSILDGFSSLTSLYWVSPPSPSPVLQWTVAKASASVRTLLGLWTQLPALSPDSGLEVIETELKNSLLHVTQPEIVQFQLACVYLELRELLGIQTNEPMLVVEHLQYIRDCLSGHKEAKQILRKQEVQLKQEQSERSALQQENANLQREKEKLQQELDLLHDTEAAARELERLKRELSKCQDQVKEENCKMAKSALDFDTRIKQANNQAQILKQSQAALQAKLTESLLFASAQSASFEQQLRSESQQTAALKAQLSQATSQASSLRRAAQAAKVECVQLKEQVYVYSQQVAEMDASLQSAFQSKAELEAQLSQSQQVSQQLQRGQATLNKRLHNMKTTATSKAKEWNQMKRTLQQWEQREQCLSSREGTGVDVLCVVCMDIPADVVFEPCRHACVCVACSARLNKCPKCRAGITRRDKVFL